MRLPFTSGWRAKPEATPEEASPSAVSNRAQRRAFGWRGMVARPRLSMVPRYVMRHYRPGMFAEAGPGVFTRRQRKHRARIRRILARRAGGIVL